MSDKKITKPKKIQQDLKMMDKIAWLENAYQISG